MPQSAQKRSSSGYLRAQRGQASGRTGASPSSVDIKDDFLELSGADPPCPHGRVVLAGERADQVQRLRPVLRQVDVGLRRLCRALRMRVVDRGDLLTAILDLHRDLELVLGVDRVAKRT